jgi:hypothetical protein
MKGAFVGMATWAERRSAGGEAGTDHGELMYDAIGREGRQTVRKKVPPLIERD